MSARELSVERFNPAEEGARDHIEIAVVGGGQAGLAMGFYLRQQGRRFIIVERGSTFPSLTRTGDCDTVAE